MSSLTFKSIESVSSPGNQGTVHHGVELTPDQAAAVLPVMVGTVGTWLVVKIGSDEYGIQAIKITR